MDNNILDAIETTLPEKQTARDEIILITDRSGSMGSIAVEAQGGINSFITEQAEAGREANLTLVEFDDKIDRVYDRVNLTEVGEYVLLPRGMTALYDAIGSTINGFDVEEGTKVVVVITTDGAENNSREYSAGTIKALIEEKTEQGWEFMFLAANQDAVETGGQLGIRKGATVTFDASGEGATRAFAAASEYSNNSRMYSAEVAETTLAADIETTDVLKQ